MGQSQPLHEPSLIDVQVAFEHWRSERTLRRPTPEHLRSLAVALLEHHVPFTICKALGVNSSALKQWATQTPKSVTTPFVTLPEEPPQTNIGDAKAADPAVLISLPNGIQISVMQGLSLSHVLAVASSLQVSA